NGAPTPSSCPTSGAAASLDAQRPGRLSSARHGRLAAVDYPRSHRVSIPARLAVFASGGGTNLQALLDHFHGPSAAAARVELVVGSREGIGAIARAEAAGVAAAV